jgi:two-component system LytT family response regulator
MEISVISAHDNYSEVQLADGAKIFLRKSLKAWEDTLPATHFMRVHRTQIVNLARVTRYERDRDEHTLLTVEGAADRIAASRDRWSDLRARLAAIRPTP